MKLEPLWEATNRIRKEGSRKPLRTLKELAEEFGISKLQLAGLLSDQGNIKPVFYRNGKGNKNSWYDPIEVRRFMHKFMASGNYYCHTCKQDLSRDHFYKNEKHLGPLSLSQPCKECQKSKRKKTKSTD